MNTVDSVIIANSIPSSWLVDEHSVQFCFHLKLLLGRGFKYIFFAKLRRRRSI